MSNPPGLSSHRKLSSCQMAAGDQKDEDEEYKELAEGESQQSSIRCASLRGQPLGPVFLELFEYHTFKILNWHRPFDYVFSLGFKNEGNDLFKQGKYKDAIDAYSKGIDIDPDNHVLFSNRSAAYLKEQERGKVRTHYERCESTDSRNISWRFRLAAFICRHADIFAP